MLKKLLMSPRMPYLVFHSLTSPYIAWLALKARSLFFYTACNPITSYHGGKTTDKSTILDHVPPQYLPKTVRIADGMDAPTAIAKATALGFGFPMIAKPDKGERGRGVVKVYSQDQLALYIAGCPGPVLLQEMIDSDYELGVLYCRYPDQQTGELSSISIKKMPVVVGDGRSTVEQLAGRERRMKLYLKKYRAIHGDLMDRVLPEGERFQLHFLGQMGAGVTFLDSRDLITPQSTAVFEKIFGPIPGFFLGRADVKLRDLDSLRTGEGIHILEINGTASVPIHIWDPDLPLWDTFAGIFDHWRRIYQISIQNHALGHRYITLADGLAYLRNHFSNAAQNEANTSDSKGP